MSNLEFNPVTYEVELYIAGEFVASWGMVTIPAASRQVICAMIDKAVEVGESKKAAEVRKVLGVRP